VTKNLYCHSCKKHYNVKKEDIELMKDNDSSFNGIEYKKGCFFKELGKIKRSKNKIKS
jgi:hypothetical protein